MTDQNITLLLPLNKFLSDIFNILFVSLHFVSFGNKGALFSSYGDLTFVSGVLVSKHSSCIISGITWYQVRIIKLSTLPK
jgi:hypothetical protein